MKTDTILRITGAVVALALIALAAWWWQLEDGREQAAGMVTAAIGLIALVLRSPLERRSGSGGPRPPRAPDVGVPPSAPRRRRHRDATRPPPGPGAAAVLAVVLVLPSAPALAACSPTQVQVHSEVGAGLQDSAREMRRVVLEYRTDRMRAAARAVYEAGGSEEEALAAAQAEGDRLEPLVEAQRLYALSAHGYATAVLLADRRGEPILDAALPALRDLVDAYRHLRELGASLGVEALAGAPDTPRVLDQYVSTQMLAQTSGGAR
jgi:hypothetical protein